MQKQIPALPAGYSEEDLDRLCFHDCHVKAISWQASKYEIVLHIDYIVEWIQPESPGAVFRFWICPAEIRFQNVDGARLQMDWKGGLPKCIIDGIIRGESRRAPTGVEESFWDIEFIEPAGSMSLWATGWKLVFTGSPVLSHSQTLEH